MRLFHAAVVLFVVSNICACASTQFKLGSPPTLTVADTFRPLPPEAIKEDVKIGTPVLFKQISTRPMPDFREVRLGLGEFDTGDDRGSVDFMKSALTVVGGMLSGGEGGGDLGSVMSAAGKMGAGKMSEAGLQLPPNLSDVLVPKLLTAGISEVVDLAQGHRVLVLMEEDVAGPSKSKATVRWASTMDQMIFVGKVSSADYVIYGRFETAAIHPEEYDVPLYYDENEMQAYGVEYAEFTRRAKANVAKLDQTFTGYKDKYDREMQRYKSEGGKLLEDDGEPNRALQAKQEYKSFEASYWGHRTALDTDLAETPSPEKLGSEILGRTEKKRVLVATVRLVARLLEAATGEIVWWEKLSMKSENLGTALNGVFDRMLHDVLIQSGARTQAPASRTAELDEI